MSSKNIVFFDTNVKKKKKGISKLSNKSQNSIPWVEKYRPRNVNEIISNDNLKVKIKQIIKEKSMPNLIITGDPGTGKTSTMLCIARIIAGEHYDDAVLELNASDDRGLNMINNNIVHFCKKKLDKVSHKIVIFDEADSITSKAQNLLNNILEEHIKNTRFAFICNDSSKITESIQSRCMILRYPRLDNISIKKRIIHICDKENIKFNNEGLETIIFTSHGDIRQAINNLESIYNTFGEITKESVFLICDKPKPHMIRCIFDYCINKDIISAMKYMIELKNLGYSGNDILLTMINMIKDDYEISLSDVNKILFMKEISRTYIKVNNGTDTLLQLNGCLSRICQKL
ncbi:Replication factor C C-terminal domain [seawater metagenome]|uniref:Replication factor C C-terminal domain n=1 Tax=seawater metagenome TaxID=1561972 RepID=A0A5E8CJR7_9ZZZZ